MIFLKTEDEIELMRAANLLVADTLTEIARNIRPGVTTRQLDSLAGVHSGPRGGSHFQGVSQPLRGAVSGIGLHVCQ